MTKAAERFFRTARAKAATLQPDIARAFLQGLKTLQSRLSERDIAAFVKSNDVDGLIRLVFSDENINAMFTPFRAQFRMAAEGAFNYTSKAIPGVPRGTAGVRFDYLNPRTLDALQQLDSVVMTRLAEDARATVREIIRRGMVDGDAPATTARQLRELIGLGPTQVEQAENFRQALINYDIAKVQTYAARNRTIDNLMARGTLTPGGIDRAVERYVAKRIALNAESTARTATFEAFKSGQKMSWDDAISKGFVDGENLQKEWIGVGDAAERDSHLAMNGTIIPFGEPWIVDGVAEEYPGAGEWGCRCQERVFVARASEVG